MLMKPGNLALYEPSVPVRCTREHPANWREASALLLRQHHEEEFLSPVFATSISCVYRRRSSPSFPARTEPCRKSLAPSRGRAFS